MRKLLCTVLLLGVMSSAGEAMTLREKVGQLFMIRPDQLNTTVSLDEIHNDKASAVGVRSVSKLMLQTLKEYPAGGFIVFRKNIESPSQLKVLTKALKDSCKVTPLMAVDEEGGRIARIANHKASSSGSTRAQPQSQTRAKQHRILRRTSRITAST